MLQGEIFILARDEHEGGDPKDRAHVALSLPSLSTDSVALTDGSVVCLDSGALLAVHRGYDTDTARFVRLQGRAHFNVVRTDPPRPFYIVAAGGVAHTAGAEFQVHALRHTLVVRGGPRGAHTGDSDGSEGIVYLAQRDLRVDNQQVFWGERAWVVRGQSVQKDIPDVGDRPPPVGATAARPLPPKKPVPRQTIASLRGRTIDPRRDWSAVGKRMELPGGVIAYLDRKTRVATEKLPFGDDIFATTVDGTALILVPRDTTKPFDVPAYVRTRAGYVAAAAPLGFIVETRTDTTLVHVLDLTQTQLVRDIFRGNYMAELYPEDLRVTPGNRFQLVAGQSARQVRGMNPVRLP